MSVKVKFRIGNKKGITANYTVKNNNPIRTIFRIGAASTAFSALKGSPYDNANLKEALDLKADKSELDADIAAVDEAISNVQTVVENNYNTLDTKIDNVNSDLSGDISTLENTVNSNNTAVNNRIDATNRNVSNLSTTVANNNTAINNRVDGIVNSFDSDISNLETAIQNEATTRANNDTLLQRNINTLRNDLTSEISNRTSADNTLQNNIDNIQNTIDNYGDIVSYNASDFATAAQGLLAESALQPNDDISELNNDAGYITSADLPTIDQIFDGTSANAQSGVAIADELIYYVPTYSENNIDITSDNSINFSTPSDSSLTLNGNPILSQYTTFDNGGSLEVSQQSLSYFDSNGNDLLDVLPGNVAKLMTVNNNNISRIDVYSNAISLSQSVDGGTNYYNADITIPANGKIAINGTEVQEKLVSGTSIKTLNNISLLGSGDITIADLTTIAQINALNSGATTAKIEQIATNTSNISSLSNTVTSNYNTLDGRITSEINTLNGAITTENTQRQAADSNLQSQIDAITSASDVFDIVGTYAELQAYDISSVPPNDIIKVLVDSTHNNAATYYRCVENDGVKSWTYIGSEGAYYTKSESDNIFVAKTTTINNKPLSSNITLTASDVSALPSSTTIGAGVLTIQKNGVNIDTFSANATANKSINIPIPTDTSDLTNNAGYIKGITSSDVITALGYTPYNASNPNGYTSNIGTVTSVNNIQPINGNVTLSIPTATSDLTNDSNFATESYVDTGLATKQDTLVSGTNIKTLNNQSLLGSGNISTLDLTYESTTETLKFE